MRILNFASAGTLETLQSLDIDFDLVREAATASVSSRKGPCIPTNSGHNIDLGDFSKALFDIQDIAHSLSNICRFTGATQRFFSVAQHSIMVCDIVPPKFKLAALLHDASEAYLGDFSAPMKRMFPDFKMLENKIERAIFETFGLDFPLHPWIKFADLIALATEQRDLMPLSSMDWAYNANIPILAKRIDPWTPNEAKAHFLARFDELIATRDQDLANIKHIQTQKTLRPSYMATQKIE